MTDKTDKSEGKLAKAFEFLNCDDNRIFNRKVQYDFYHRCLSPYSSSKDRIQSFLFDIVNSQSQPRLEKLAAFWKGFELGRNDCFETYDGLIGLLTNIAEDEQKSSLGQLGKINSRTKWDHLFAVLQLCPGWGEKTAALFVKAAYLIHADTKNEALRFWRNAPELVDGDRIYLPVDAVMKHIFQEHFSKRLNTFSSINNYIFQHGYTPHQMIIWDDLWFWGFITQNSKNGSRIDVWNEAKYWTQQHTCKEQSSIDEVKKRAEEFLEILKS